MEHTLLLEVQRKGKITEVLPRKAGAAATVKQIG